MTSDVILSELVAVRVEKPPSEARGGASAEPSRLDWLSASCSQWQRLVTEKAPDARYLRNFAS